MRIKRATYRLSRSEIVRRIHDVHGDTVSIAHFDDLIMQNTSQRITLRCNNCRMVWNPTIKSVIYSGSGCPGCACNTKMTLTEFIDIASALYEGRFDYSLNTTFDYKDWITVCCSVCSHTWVTHPNNHLIGKTRCVVCTYSKECTICHSIWRGRGKKCSQCVGVKKPSLPDSIIEWMWMCTKMHNGQYEYSHIRSYTDKCIVQCTKCKHHTRTSFDDHMSSAFGCLWCESVPKSVPTK
jgi:hypothetical protein